MAPYLTAAQIEDRLDSRFDISATITDGDADIASDELDSLAPFIGSKLDSEQEREFPRTLKADGTPNEDVDVPARILDWVALKAYTFTLGPTGHTAGISSESIGNTSRSYATPRLSQEDRRMSAMIKPYLLRYTNTALVGGFPPS